MTHEFDGNKYAQASAHQKEWGRRLISELDFSGIESILDMGCGDGALTQILSEMVPKGTVVGIDASKGMIDVAKEKETPNLEFIFMKIEKPPANSCCRGLMSRQANHYIFQLNLAPYVRGMPHTP